MKPTFIQSPLWLIAILTLFTTCGHDQDAGETPSPADIYITIDSEGVLAYAQPGDEVPDFISMYNGEADYQARTHGAANLVTELVPGQQVNWILEQHEGLKIVGFDFQVLEGDDFFSAPVVQPDGSWTTDVAPDAAIGSVIKYSVLFEINGQQYWWDPLAKISTST